MGGIASRSRGQHVFGEVTVEDDETAEHVSVVKAKQVVFTESDGSAPGTYTGAVTIPAGATVIDVKVRSTALWDAGTDAQMIVGDTDDDNGFYESFSVKVTDLAVGEELNFENHGGKVGALLDATSGLRKSHYTAAAKQIVGVVTTTGTLGTAGVTLMTVVYVDPTPAGIKASTFAAT